MGLTLRRLAPAATPLAIVLAAVLSFVAAASEATVVLLPVAAGAAVCAAYSWVLAMRRHGRVPWFEIGTLYVAVVFLYLAYPLVGFVAIGLHYSPTNDVRLQFAQPSAWQIAGIGWLYVAHLFGFVTAYVAVRGRLELRGVALAPPDGALVITILVAYGAIELYIFALGLFYNMRAATYLDTYLISRRLPLLVAQLLNHLNGMRHALAVMLMAALFSRYSRSRWIIAAWLLLAGVVTVARLGSRTDLVLLVVAAVVMYDAMVRPISARVLAGLATTGLLAFVVFGIARNAAAGLPLASRNPFAYASEFENLLANGVHLAALGSALPRLPAAFYLADIAALLPQQLAPFTKVTPADWYVTTYFPSYAAQGGGLAFGTIAEAILTGGWVSALLRGMALGCCFAWLCRLQAEHPRSFWMFAFYVWTATLCYQSFRNTTFYLIVLTAFRFVPAMIGVRTAALALRRAASALRPAQSAAGAQA